MFKKTSTALRFDLSEEGPDYAQWDTKIRELKDSVSVFDREESELLHRLANRQRTPSNATNRAVSELLGDVIDESDPLVDGLRARLTSVQSQRRDRLAAIAIAEQRRAQARMTASAKITARILPEYKKRVGALAEALITAHRANRDLWDLTSALTDADVAWPGVLRPVPATRMLGEPNNPGNRVGLWLAEAASYGLIDKKTIPVELSA